MSTVNTTANVEKDYISLFSSEAINEALLLAEKGLFDFFQENENDDLEDLSDSKYPSPDIFYKGKGSTRYIRAFFFSLAARSQGILPLKITFYINALESLFSTANTELSYRIAERVALLLKDNKEERVILFNKIKKAYNFRSKVVHGDYIKLRNNQEEELIEISTMLDNVIRKLLTEHKDLFDEEDNQKLETIFLDLTFNNS